MQVTKPDISDVVSGLCKAAQFNGMAVRPGFVETPAGDVNALISQIFKYRRIRRRDAVIIIRYRMNKQAWDRTIEHFNISDITAALGGPFNFNTNHGIFQITVPYLDIFNSTGYFTSHTKSMTECTVTIKNPNMTAGAANQISFGIFPGFYRYGVVTSVEETGKDSAVFRGIGVPAVAIPDTGAFKCAVIGDDVAGVDHMDIPGGTVSQSEAADTDIRAVADIDQAAPYPAGNGIAVFTGGD